MTTIQHVKSDHEDPGPVSWIMAVRRGQSSALVPEGLGRAQLHCSDVSFIIKPGSPSVQSESFGFLSISFLSLSRWCVTEFIGPSFLLAANIYTQFSSLPLAQRPPLPRLQLLDSLPH